MRELMLLEIQMNTLDTSDMNIICEDAITAVSNACLKIVALIKKIIAEMNDFVKQVQITLESGAYQVKMSRMLSKIESDLKKGKGGPISIVDMESVAKLYQKDIVILRREIQSIGTELKKFSIRGNTGKIERYSNKKKDLQKEIDDMLMNLEIATQKRIVVKPEMAKKEITEIIRKQRMFMTDYASVIYDFERLISEFERETKKAETDYALRAAVQSYQTPIHQLKMGATKLLRKSVFAATVVTGVVI